MAGKYDIFMFYQNKFTDKSPRTVYTGAMLSVVNKPTVTFIAKFSTYLGDQLG